MRANSASRSWPGDGTAARVRAGGRPAVAYDPWQAVVTHRFEDGRSSCAAAPWLVAAMLAQLAGPAIDKVRSRFVLTGARTRP